MVIIRNFEPTQCGKWQAMSSWQHESSVFEGPIQLTGDEGSYLPNDRLCLRKYKTTETVHQGQ